MKRHLVFNKYFVIVIACLMIAIFASNNPITDYLKVQYASASNAISKITDAEGELDTSVVNNILNKGVTSSYKEGVKTYISDLVMASDDNSADAAKELLRKNGYMVINQNMNDGTSKGYVYLGYKETTNELDAITDISIMNMKGDYRLMDYADVAQEKKDNLYTLVDEVKHMIGEFQTNYSKKSATAKIALAGLNKITYTNPNTKITKNLGDILLNKDQYNDKFLYDMLLMANSAIVSGIYNYLTLAVENTTFSIDHGGSIIKTGEKSWLEKIVYEDLDEYWALYESKVLGIFTFLEEFAQGCKNAILLYEENGKTLPNLKKTKEEIFNEYKESDMETAKETDTESIYLAAYMMLKEYKYGDGTLADLFVPRKSNGEFIKLTMERFAPLVKSLTPGQFAAVHTGNFVTLLNNAVVSQNGYDTALAGIGKSFKTDKLNGTIDLFAGVNKEIFNDKVGVTDAAYRQMSMRNNYDIATAPDSTLLEEVNMWVGIGTSALMVVTSFFPFITALSGLFPTLFAKFATASAILSFAQAAATTTICSILNWASLALVVVVLLVMLGFWIADQVDYYNPTYSPIPSLMFDVQGDEYVSYKAVEDLRRPNGDPNNNGDLNNFKGLQWNAVYYTKDTRAGDPLMLNNSAGEGLKVFKIQSGGWSNTPSGYEPVTNFGQRNAYNTNTYSYKDTVGGIYLFYLVDGTLSSDKITPMRKYVSRILLRAEKTDDAAKYYLSSKGFTPIEYNLTSGIKERATYIGIQTTDDPTQALTDLRIAYGTNQDNIMFGKSSYGMCGFSGLEPDKIDDNKVGPIAETEYSLYATADKTRGSAIYSNFTVRTSLDKSNLGDEPINLFSGGGAFNFCVSGVGAPAENYVRPVYVYFSPSIKYTSGVRYFAGVMQLENLVASSNTETQNDINRRFFDKFQGDEVGIKFYNLKTKFIYNTTYNPKRALGDITMFKQMTDDPANINYSLVVPDNIYNRELGYLACERIQRKFSMFSGVYTSSAKNNKALNSMALYVAPASDDLPPLKMYEDIQFCTNNIPSGFRNISRLDAYYEYNHYNINYLPNDTIEKGYIALKRDYPVKTKYLASVIPSFSNVENFALDYARINAVAAGAEAFTPYNLNAEEVDNKMGTLGFTYTNIKTKSVRDVALYYIQGKSEPTSNYKDKTHEVPPKKIKQYGIEYERVGTNYIYAGRLFYIYFYVTYSSLAGEPITEVYFDKNMMNIAGETSQVLSYGAESIQGFYYMHLKRSGPQKYIKHIDATDKHFSRGTLYNKATHNYVGEAWIDKVDYPRLFLQQKGCTTMLAGNLNVNTKGSEYDNSEPCYMGYSRTSSKAAAITDIIVRTIPQNLSGSQREDALFRFKHLEHGKYVYNGIEYTRVDQNLNVNGEPMFMYYTTDSRAGSPITDIHLEGGTSCIYSTNNVVKFTPDCKISASGGYANLNYNTPVYDNNRYNSAVFIHYQRADGSVGKGNSSSVASVFSNPTAVLLISFAVVLSSGLTVLAFYGRSKKRKNNLLNK